MFKGSAHLPDGLMDKLLEGRGRLVERVHVERHDRLPERRERRTSSSRCCGSTPTGSPGCTDTLDKPKLDNQRDVVLNERRQSYENQPYGIAELFIQENAVAGGPRLSLVDDRLPGRPQGRRAAATSSAFFKKYYVPNNATMVIAGDVKFDEVKKLVEKYFAWIPKARRAGAPAVQDAGADHEGDRGRHDRRRAGAARVPRVARPGGVHAPTSRRSTWRPRCSATASRAGSTSASSTTRRSRRTCAAGFDGETLGGDVRRSSRPRSRASIRKRLDQGDQRGGREAVGDRARGQGARARAELARGGLPQRARADAAARDPARAVRRARRTTPITSRRTSRAIARSRPRRSRTPPRSI